MNTEILSVYLNVCFQAACEDITVGFSPVSISYARSCTVAWQEDKRNLLNLQSNLFSNLQTAQISLMSSKPPKITSVRF